MKRVCAWCGKSMGETKAAGAGVTHGICPDCRNFFDQPEPGSFTEFLDRLGTPVVCVDVEARVLAANRAARSRFGIPEPGVDILLPGNIVGCEWARRPGGCGKQDRCLACAIRSAVRRAAGKGETVLREPGTVERREADGRTVCIPVSVSAAPRQGVVFLRIDDADVEFRSQPLRVIPGRAGTASSPSGPRDPT